MSSKTTEASRSENSSPAGTASARQSPPQSPPFTALAIASGKGGVGKTMLSVALAYELSQNAPTLIIDLDFFNRGLTGLLRAGKTVKDLDAPKLLPELAASGQGQPGVAPDHAEHLAAQPDSGAAAWQLVEISDNLFNIRYPDLSTDDYARIENMQIGDLAQDLSDYIAYVAGVCGAHFVVLDCHGGPDRTSFAACKIAKTTLLISEPDRITLYGTLNFLRQLADAGGASADHDIRLVLNKVVSSFNSPFLQRFYNENIRSEFAGKPLLAMFPMEEYLTKAFEKNALLAKVYPESLLARKTRVYIHDLLARTDAAHLSPDLKGLTRIERHITRSTLGREFILLSNNFAIAMIFSIAMVLMAVSVVADYGRGVLSTETISVMRDFVDVFTDVPYFAILGVFWFALTLFRSWVQNLSRTAIFLARTGSRVRAGFAALAKAIVVAPLVAMLGAFIGEMETAWRYAYDEGFLFEALVDSDVLTVLIPIAFCVTFLGEYYFYNLKRATRLRRYQRIGKTEGLADAIAIVLPVLIGAPLWSVFI